MKLVNLTGQTLRLADGSGSVVSTLPPDELSASVMVFEDTIAEVSGFPIIQVTFRHLRGLPEPSEGCLYVVPMTVKEAAKAIGRTDVVSPNLGPTALLRDGVVYAVRSLKK